MFLLPIRAASSANIGTFLSFASYLSQIQLVKVFRLSQFVRHEPLAFVETEQICRPPCYGKLRVFSFFNSIFTRPCLFCHGTLIPNRINSILCLSKRGDVCLKLCVTLSWHPTCTISNILRINSQFESGKQPCEREGGDSKLIP